VYEVGRSRPAHRDEDSEDEEETSEEDEEVSRYSILNRPSIYAM